MLPPKEKLLQKNVKFVLTQALLQFTSLVMENTLQIKDLEKFWKGYLCIWLRNYNQISLHNSYDSYVIRDRHKFESGKWLSLMSFSGMLLQCTASWLCKP